MSLFFLIFAFLMSLGTLRSIFEPVEDTIQKIRDSNPWTFRISQIFCLISLLVVQSLLFGSFGTASFSGLSLLLYLVIIWEAVWIVLFWGGWGLDFLSENPAIALGLKLFSAGQALVVIVFIAGWFGIGPAASEFITGATAQKVLTQNAPALKNFTGHWRHLLKTDYGQTEELFDAYVNGKDFVIIKKTGVVQRTNVYSNGQLTEIINIVGSGERKAEPAEAIPVMLRRQMFWMASEGLTKAADQSNPPGSRPMTLFTREENIKNTSFKEWTDNETGIVLYREEKFGENADILEFISLETDPVPESVFNPDLY